MTKAEAWVKEYGGAHGLTPRDAADGADFVMACVGNDDDLRAVCLGEDGAFAGMPSGSVFVDHTTVSAKVTTELHDVAADAGIAFVDAPVSGGQAGAENGVLSVMCGGDADAYAKAEPIIDAYSKICRRIGDSGAGLGGAAGLLAQAVQDHDPKLLFITAVCWAIGCRQTLV